MLEISGFARETPTVLRIWHPFAPPEIRSICCIGVCGFDLSYEVVPSDDIRYATCCSRIFKSIPRRSLGNIRTDSHSKVYHAGFYKTHACLDGGCTCLACEFEVCRSEIRSCTYRLRDHGTCWFYCIW